ncbi:VCBS repeat-containing protein [Thalassomonas sp. RHCl1]|uniref:FG-GAP repeat domain-containing protein n=1 Tax=Thalassomonas sp. RHCl1 TaxID=2995320 RepID=UPI00248BB71B|nr:VCBS repeat-containing protein [Thalassomonas sp. RHCl1]
MLKKVFPYCSLAAIIASLSPYANAGLTEEHRSHVPWKYQELSAAEFGGDWGKLSEVYIADIDGNGSADLIRQNKDIDADALDIFLSHATTEGRQVGPDDSLFRSGEVGFTDVNLTDSFIWQFAGDHTDLHFGQFNDGGDDLLRQENTKEWAKDEFNSGDIYSGYFFGTHSYPLVDTQDLGDAYNGLNNENQLSLGDFNGDGLTDVLIRDKGPDKEEDGTYNVLVAFSIPESGTGNRHKAKLDGRSHVTMNSESDGDSDDPNWLFAADNSNVRIGDFNGDGRSDILRWDTKDNMPNLSDDHAKVDIWFGLGTTGEFQRSSIYLDADADYRKTSSDNIFDESFVELAQNKIRIGDFNGDGSDDFVVLDGHDYTVYISHAVRIEEDSDGKRETFKQNIALFSQNGFNDEYVNLNSPELITIGDFNNDDKDDIALWNGIPYILYSTSGAIGGDSSSGDEATATELTFTGIHHDKTINGQGAINSHFSGQRSTYQKMQSADFSGDGVPDLLLIPEARDESTPNAVIYITPPYNPVSAVSQTPLTNVNHMQGITHQEKQFVFFGENDAIKYIFRDEAGWHEPETLTLYEKNNDPRCNNDKPEGAEFLASAHLTPGGALPQDSAVDKYLQPVCDAAYQGQTFDVVSDGQYLYLFRGHGTAVAAKVLVERFDFSDVDNKLIRLVESRFSLSGKRYVNSSGSETITEAKHTQNFGDQDDLSTVDAVGDTFYEPAFLVPFAASEITNSPDCKVKAVTVVRVDEGNGRERFMLSTKVSDACMTTDGYTVKLLNIRKGTEQLFATSNLTYLDDRGEEITSYWYYDRGLLKYTGNYLDSVVIETIATATHSEGEKTDEVVGTEYLLASSNGDSGFIVTHYSLNEDTTIAANMAKSSISGSDVATQPRFYSGSDGLTHLYWRGNGSTTRQKVLQENIMDPYLSESSRGLQPNWGTSPGQSVREMSFAESWPMPDDEQNPAQALAVPRDLPNYVPAKWTPKFGTYYQGNDKPIAHTIAPLAFETSRLIDKGGLKSGLLVREFVELHQEQDGRYRVAFSEVPLVELEARLTGRVTLDSTPIGFIEGAPPVPRENLGRDQNGKWGYSAELSSVELRIESGTTVSTNANDAGGATASGRLTVGGKSPFIEISIDTVVNLKTGAFSGRDESYALEEEISRQSFITGSVPTRECMGEESPYLDACYTLNADGSKAVELWAPHTEGAIFVSSLSGSRYSLHNPDDGKLVGYALDFSDATVQEQVYKVKLNKAYQVAGSLDGFIGPDQVQGLGQGYFNPRQENAWLLESTRQQQELEERYAKARTTSVGQSAEEFVNDQLLIADIAVTDGAFKSKSSKAVSSITDYYGYEIETDASSTFNFENPPTGAGFGAGAGGYYSRNFQQGQTVGESIFLEADIDRAVTSEVQDENNNTLPNTVDRYNTRSYLLPASEGNFQDLFDYVIDPKLLEGDDFHEGDKSTVDMLRIIQSKPNPMWRIVHRVDGVSRPIVNPGNGSE